MSISYEEFRKRMEEIEWMQWLEREAKTGGAGAGELAEVQLAIEDRAKQNPGGVPDFIKHTPKELWRKLREHMADMGQSEEDEYWRRLNVDAAAAMKARFEYLARMKKSDRDQTH